ncbi:hypothetical protein Cgig2_029808 [Carnegiea gigantea]|uniref:Uncharacterized protein n=1 Tax=Carnegiea gigantea TaxID=171969 RepID=A0A9Q1KKF2_9CARY|nr:hypothetical protein Cgig2_029808 [Carnegiea gigantea]
METALFSASSLFGDASDKSSDEETDTQENFAERTHQFPGMELVVREFSFHQLNANLLWPGTFAFAEWLVQHGSWVEGRCVLELGRHVIGTGALAIFLKRFLQLDITTSDYDDQEIQDNIGVYSSQAEPELELAKLGSRKFARLVSLTPLSPARAHEPGVIRLKLAKSQAWQAKKCKAVSKVDKDPFLSTKVLPASRECEYVFSE